MKVVCSYCRSLMREKEPFSDPSVTHAICAACFEHYATQWDGLSLAEFLDRFEVPVVALDGNTRVLAVNTAAAARSGVTDRNAMGMLAGDLLECERARLPGGCGHSIHCAACAIRNTVTSAATTTGSRPAVPASLTTTNRGVDLWLSTQVREGVVFLTIETA